MMHACRSALILLCSVLSLGLCLGLSLGLTLGVPSAALAESPQQRWAGDIPLMSGLEIEPELGFAFDAPSGRIVMIFASGGPQAADLHDFYAATLPSLGWQKQGPVWLRQGESLTISQVETAMGLLWRIMLRPQ